MQALELHESARFTAKSDRELANTFFFLDVYFPLAPFQLVEPARELVRDWLQPRDKLDEWDRDDATIRWVLAIPLRSSDYSMRTILPDPGKQFDHITSRRTRITDPSLAVYGQIFTFRRTIVFPANVEKGRKKGDDDDDRRRRPLAVPPDGYTRAAAAAAAPCTVAHVLSSVIFLLRLVVVLVARYDSDCQRKIS